VLANTPAAATPAPSERKGLAAAVRDVKHRILPTFGPQAAGGDLTRALGELERALGDAAPSALTATLAHARAAVALLSLDTSGHADLDVVLLTLGRIESLASRVRSDTPDWRQR
jgi:hypothetical protein